MAGSHAIPARAGGLAPRARAWAVRAVNLVPTPWIITAAGAALLGMTAAFGGLETVPPQSAPTISVGDAYSGSDLSMTVVRVEVADERPGSGVFADPDDGERVLTVVVDAVNEFPRPRLTTSTDRRSATIDGIIVEGLDEKPVVSREDDRTGAPVLQPGVPTRLVLAWKVGSGDFRDGDPVRITLPDSTHTVGTSVISGDYWVDVHPGAHVEATVDEVSSE